MGATQKLLIESDNFRKSRKWAFAFIVATWCLYGGIFIYRSSFELHGTRYFSLFDDAMVSLRYAKNLAAGYGLVWNRGERPAQGYTCPLWVLWMAVLELLPIAQSKISALLQISGALCLAANLFVVRKLSQHISGPGAAAWLIAVLLNATFYPLNYWGLMGMETGPLTLLVSLVALLNVRAIAKRRFSYCPFMILGVACWVRPDAFVFALASAFVMGCYSRSANRLRYGLLGVLVAGVPLVVLLAWQHYYYGDALPCTFYLKATGFPLLNRMLRGLFVAGDSTLRFGLIPVALAIATCLRGSPVHLSLLAMLGAQLFYSIYIGGDSWELYGGGYGSRFLVTVAPLLFTLLADAVWRVWQEFQCMLPMSFHRPALIALLLSVAVGANSYDGADSLARSLLLVRPFEVSANRTAVLISEAVRRVSQRNARVAVHSAGVTPFFIEQNTIDLLGKCDRHISRQKSHTPTELRRFRLFAPGQTKWDWSYSLEGLHANVIVRPNELKDYDPTIHLGDDWVPIRVEGETQLLLRKNSPHLNWDAVDSLGQRGEASN